MENQENKPVQSSGQLLPLPNSTGALVLGIISLVTWCWCAGLVGLTLGIIGLVLAKKANALYEESPEKYKIESYKNMKAGRVCSLIGLILASLVVLLYIIILVLGIGSASLIPWEAMDSWNF